MRENRNSSHYGGGSFSICTESWNFIGCQLPNMVIKCSPCPFLWITSGFPQLGTVEIIVRDDEPPLCPAPIYAILWCSLYLCLMSILYNTIQPSLQIRSTLILSNGLPHSSLLLWYHRRLTHDHMQVLPIATLMDEPWTNGHSLWSLSLSLLSTMCKHCDQFIRPFTLFSDSRT